MKLLLLYYCYCIISSNHLILLTASKVIDPDLNRNLFPLLDSLLMAYLTRVMLISDALYAVMGYCPSVSCLRVRGLRIQEGQTKITRLLVHSRND